MNNFQTARLPETGFLRLPNIIGNPRANPPIPPLIPVGKSCWWEGVRSGRFPRPVKIGRRVTAWRVEDIRALIAQPEPGARHDEFVPQLLRKSRPQSASKKEGWR